MINGEFFEVFAHKNEYFHEHISKTINIFNILKSENILKDFYNEFKEKNFINLNYDEFIFLIQECVKFHDIGKLSFNFQINRLNKNNIPIRDKQLSILKKFGFNQHHINSFEGDHSLSSALSFLSKYNNQFPNNELFFLILAYSIVGHHSNIKDIKNEDDYFFNEIENNSSLNLNLKFFSSFLYLPDISQLFFQNINEKGFEFLEGISNYDSLFSFFYSYIYSLLISADSLATSEYDIPANQIDYKKFNHRISHNLFEHMSKSFYEKSYNKNLLNETFDIKYLKTDDIDILRKEMLLESSESLKNNLENNKIFFLNMPTGGGKTNTSMKLALDLIKDTDANRIIYAMPFINIIEQNFDVICELFGLNEDDGEGNIRKIYSASETIFDDKSDEETLEIILSDDFFNYPVVCTTFVSLFNPIIKNKKKYKYRLNALTNSVIILDEIQSLPLKNWNSLYFLINEISRKYNIYFLIMSATLPNFDKLKLENYRANENSLIFNNVSLIDNPEKYFNHDLFSRTTINGNIKNLKINDNELMDYLMKIINENFNQNYNKGLIVLNTIKSSRIIYDKLKEFSQECGFDIDLLNSSILPSKRKNIIYKINKMNTLDDFSNYILVSTQSIEAGVDVSFDFVIRDFSILDSIEQVRGRCNRSRELNRKFGKEDSEGNVIEKKDQKGNVYLINLKDDNNNLYKYIYGKDERTTRIKETNEIFNNVSEYHNSNYQFEDILNYYDNVSKDINEIFDAMDQSFIRNDRKNIEFWNKMKYSYIQKPEGIHIIHNDLNQYSLFIPLNLKIYEDSLNLNKTIEDMDSDELISVYGDYESEFIFSLNEILFLKDFGDCLIEGDYVIGENIVDIFQSMIEEAKSNFSQKLLVQKKFSSILNNFLVNIAVNNQNLEDKIKELDRAGYFYILEKNMIGDSEEDIYSEEYGFNLNPIIHEIY